MYYQLFIKYRVPFARIKEIKSYYDFSTKYKSEEIANEALDILPNPIKKDCEVLKIEWL